MSFYPDIGLIYDIFGPDPEDVEAQAQQLVADFPAALNQAEKDFDRFTAGLKLNLFTPSEFEYLNDWFSKFPTLWEGIRPDYEKAGSMVSPHKLAVKKQADAFVARLNATPRTDGGLGFPLIAVGIIIVLAAFGTAGIIWGLGYLKEQKNVSTMIDQVVAGKLPATVLERPAGSDQSIFADIADVGKIALFGGLLYLGWPLIQKWVKNAKG